MAVAERLEDHTVVTYDRRGTLRSGRDDWPGAGSSQHADDAAAVLHADAATPDWSALAVMLACGLDIPSETRLYLWFFIGLTVFGVFGCFPFYLPELFPTRLRSTGAGFCYNIGRIVAAGGTVFFGIFVKVGDYRQALLYAGFLFIPAALVSRRPVDRLHQAGQRQVRHRRDEARRLGRTHPHGGLPQRGAHLGAEQPCADVLPRYAGAQWRAAALVGGHHRLQRAARAHRGFRFRSGLVAQAQLRGDLLRTQRGRGAS